jgi:site-specific recombinase XerC
VLPRFGSHRLGHLPPDDIENWLNDELDAGLAASSVHRHYRTLRRMLQVAVEKQKIAANPCDRVHPPRVPKREMTFLDWEQAVELAEAHAERYRTLIYLAVDSGTRWSELVGLRRARLDVRNRKVA